MEIQVLVGMIASGKSTYCKERAQKGWVILNDDAIINMLHANIYSLYDEKWKPLYKSIEDHVFHTAIAMGKSLVIDRGLDISAKSRARWISLARSLDVPISAVVFQRFKPETHARRRAMADSRGHDYQYWLKVAKVHLSRYEYPSLNEGFDKIEHQNWRKSTTK